MSGLLGHMAAGGATGYANAQNARTEALNRVESAMFSAEIQDMFQQRRDERMAVADDARYQRDIARDDVKFARDRAAKKEDFSAASEHDLRKIDAMTERDLKKLEVGHGYNKDLESTRQAAINQRAKMTQDNAERRHKERMAAGLLNVGSSGSSGSFSQKDITKANESDAKRIFDLQRELLDPMNARNAERSELLKSEIRRLKDGIASRKYGDAQPNLNALFDDQPQSRQQPQFTSDEWGASIRSDSARQVQVEPVRRSPRNLRELENTLRGLPANDGSRSELQGAFDSMRPLIERLRMVEAELRSLPINSGEDRRAALNAKRNELEQEIQGRLAQG